MKKKVLYGVTLALLGCASMVSLQSCKDDLSDLQQQVDFDKRNNFASLKELWDYCRDNGDESLNGRLKTLEDFLDAIMKDYPTDDENNGGQNFADAFKNVYKALYGDPEATDPLEKKGLIQAFKEQELTVQDLEERVAVLENQVDAIIHRLDNLITGIIIQRAFGDVFGDFSLPIGVKSNMLFNWYGKKVTEIDKFPSSDWDDVAATVDFTKFTQESVADYYKEINLGTLYLTVNPVNHKFDDTKFTLETSAGNTLPAAFALNIAESNKELMFGSTRSALNGFYEANLEIENTDENVGAIEVHLDEAKLKSAVKAVAKDPSLSSASQLVKAVYDQLKVQVPAYAVRYDWEAPAANFTASRDEDGNVTVEPTDAEKANTKYAVLSEYGLAVATARPLSYNSLKNSGVSSNKQLPTGHLVNFFNKLRDKALEKIKVDAVASVKGYKVVVDEITFENAPNNGGIIAKISGMSVDGKLVSLLALPLLEGKGFDEKGNETTVGYPVQILGPGKFEVACGTNVEGAVELVNQALVEALCAATDNSDNDAFRAEAQLKLNAILLEMNNQINDIVADIKGSIKSGFDSVENSNYFDRVNKVFDLYNKIANKINHFLADPNAALQVNALYDTADEFGLLSQSATDPTPFVGNGNAIKIYLTSNTGEFLAPAYKKFFACTDTSVNSGDLGTVLPGTTPYVEIDATKLTKNQTYEFVYQALDYSGYTSTKKFYIVVK